MKRFRKKNKNTTLSKKDTADTNFRDTTKTRNGKMKNGNKA